MGYTLTNGLSDLSKELGENTVNTTSVRIKHYNDAVIQFAKDKKWRFLCKENTSLTTDGNSDNEYDTSGITDMRRPGGIKEITIGSSSTPYLPIDYDERNDSKNNGKARFYFLPDGETIRFTTDVGSGDTIHIWHYYIPARIEDTASVSTFPIPDHMRKVVGTLAAAYTQWGRYLEAPGNRLYNLYTRMIQDEISFDSQRPSGNPRKLKHYLQYIGFRRTYR